AALPRRAWRAILTPTESRIDHAAFRQERRAVALVEGPVVTCLHLIAEQRRVPAQFADHGLGARVEQQLVGIETVARLRLIRPVHAIAVDSAGTRVGQKAVPYLVGVFGQLNAFELALAVIVEQAELDLRGVTGEQREIHAASGPGRAQRKRMPFGDARGPPSRPSPFVFCRYI